MVTVTDLHQLLIYGDGDRDGVGAVDGDCDDGLDEDDPSDALVVITTMASNSLDGGYGSDRISPPGEE